MDKSRQPKIGRIGRQIIYMVILPVLLISLSTGIVTAIRLNRLLIEQAKTQLDDMAVAASAGLNAEVHLIENVLGIAALAFQDQFNHQQYTDEGEAYIDEYMKKYDGFIREGLGNFSGAVGFYLMFASGYGDPPPAIWYYDDPYQKIDPVRMESYVDPREYSHQDPDFQYYHVPVLSGQAHWTGIYYDPDIDQHVISYSVPVFSEGKIIGILGVDYTAFKFGEFLSRFDNGETGYAFVFSAEEAMIYHPVVPFGMTLDEFSTPGTDDLVNKLKSIGNQGVFSYTYADSEKYMAYRRMENGWVVGVTLEEDRILSAVRENRLSTLVAISSSFLLAFLVSTLLTRSITNPLNQMNHEIAWALSDNSHQLNLSKVSTRNNEIGEVSRAFQKLHYKNRENVELLIHENLEKERLAAMGDKLPDISHEVQGKLGTVVTAVSFVADTVQAASEQHPDKTFDTISEGLQLAQSAAAQATRIMQSVKNTSAAQLNMHETNFNLRNLVDDIVVGLNHLARRKNISYDLQIPDVLMLKGHAGYIIQILDNLIGNSLRHGFRDQRKGRIAINAEYRDDLLILDYTDDGTGISADIVDKVFDRFFTTAKDAGGTGIGLYLVRTLVEQEMDGTIEIRDRDTPGVHFHMKLKKLESPED